jgi:hypothetical protein
MKRSILPFSVNTWLFFVALIFAMFTSSTLNAADRYAVATGNWNQIGSTIWSDSPGGASGFSVPVAGDNVFIPGTVIVTVTAAAACANLTLSDAASKLVINSGQTITVSGSFLNNGTTTNGVNGPGTISFSGTTNLGVLTATGTRPNVTITSSGVVTVTATTLVANLVLNATTSKLIIGSGMTIDLSGTYANSGTGTNGVNGPGTIQFSGSTYTVANAFTSTTYPNLSVGNGTSSTTVSISVSTSVVNLSLLGAESKLLINDTRTLTVSGSFSNAGTGLNGVNGSGTGTIRFTGSATFGTLTVDGTPPNVTIGDGITNNTVIITSPTSVGDLSVSSNATLSNYGVTVIIAGNLSVIGTFNAGSGIYTFIGDGMSISGSTVTIPNLSTGGYLINNGTLTVSTDLSGLGWLSNSASGVLNIGGTCTVNLDVATPGNTVKYDKTGDQIIKGEGTTYYNLILAGSGVKTIDNIVIDDAGTLSMEGTVTTAATTLPLFNGSSKLLYNKTTSHTTGVEWISPFTGTGGVVISNTGIITQDGPKSYNNTVPLTVNSNATINTSTFSNSFGTGATVTINGKLQTANTNGFSGGASTTITSTNTPTIALGASSTIEYTALGGGQVVTGRTYGGNLLLDNTSGTNTVNGAITVTGTFTTTSGGILNMATYALSVSSLLHAGILKTQNTSSAPISTGKIWGGTVEYNATAGGQTIMSAISYNNLTVNHASGTNTASGSFTVNGILNLTNANPSISVSCLSMGSYILTMGADATTVGLGDVTGIVQRTSIVPDIVYSFGNQYTTISLSSGQTMPSLISVTISTGTAPSWSTTPIFRQYDIYQTGGNSATLAMLSLHYTDAEINGNTENILSFFDNSSSAPGTDLGRSNRNLSDNWVELSNISLTYFPTAAATKYWTLRNSSTESTKCVWTGLTDTDWTNAGNWNANGVPISSSDVVIPDVTGKFAPTLPGSITLNTLEIRSGGVLNAGSGTYTIAGSSGAWMNVGGTFNKSTSTISFTGAEATVGGVTDFYNVNVATGAALTPGSDNTMRISNTFTLTGTAIFNGGTSRNIIEYNGAAQTVVAPNGLNPGFYDLILSGSGIKTMPGTDFVIHGTFEMSGSSSATAASGLTFKGNTTIGSGTTFDASTYTHYVERDWTNNGGTFTPSTSSFHFTGTTEQTINGSAASQTFYNMVIEKSAGTQLALSGSTVTLSAQNFTETTGNFAAPATFNVNGNILLDGGTYTAGSALNLLGNFTNNSIFTARSGTLDCKSGSAQSISGTNSTTFNNLTISNNSTVSLAKSASLTGDLNINSGSTFDLTDFSCNRSTSGGTMTVAGTMKLANNTGGQNGSNFPLRFTTMTMTGGTVEYNGALVDQIVYAGPTYNNLVTSNAGVKSLNANLPQITGNLTVNTTSTFNMVSYTCNRSTTSGGTLTVAGTLRLSGTTGGALLTGSNFPGRFTTKTMTGGTVNYYGTGTQTVYGHSSVTYNNLLISNTGTKILSASLPDITGYLYITSESTFDLKTYTANHTATTGTMTVDGTIKLGANTGGESGSNYPIRYTTRTLTTGSTVEYNAANTITQIIYSGLPIYKNLTLTNGLGADSVAVKTITAHLTIDEIFTVNLGAQLQVPVLLNVTANGNTAIKSPRGLWLKCDATGQASFLDNGTITYENRGTAKVDLYLTSCTTLGCWHYVSSPITNGVSGVFLDDYLRWYNADNAAWSTNYGQLYYPLSIMKGWAVSEQDIHIGTGGLRMHTSIGPLNTDVPSYALQVQNGQTYGWNLVGNPYPSSVNIDNENIGWTNIEPKVWYLEQSAVGEDVYRVAIVGGAGSTGSQYIPSQQGVFVHVINSSPSLTFPNEARVHYHDLGKPFYKEEAISNSSDVLYLKAQGAGKESYDIASVVFRDYSTPNYDNAYDAYLFPGGARAPQLYTVSDDNSYLTINSLPFAGKNTTVPLSFNVRENGTGSYVLTASNLGSFSYGTTITLEDKKLAKTQELTKNAVYNFNYTSGDDASRFLLHFYNPAYGINDVGRKDDTQIYSDGYDVYVKDFTGHPVSGDLHIYNMIGQEVLKEPVAAITVNKYAVNLPGGYYIVRVIMKDKIIVNKIYLN